MLNPESLIRSLNLKPHPEGGYYYRYHESDDVVTTQTNHLRNSMSAIYYLLPKGCFCALHRLPVQEIWAFQLGCPLEISMILPNSKNQHAILGQHLTRGEKLSYVIPKNCWFGAKALGDFALVSCILAPGFDQKDCEMGKRDDLLKAYPHAKETILSLTPGN